jgi:hypothetical protein
MSNSMITDKRNMFDLLTKILDRGRKDRDAELVTYVEQATELWTEMMMEEYDHDQKCIQNVHDMQDVCDAWLKELLSILKGGLAESGMTGAEAVSPVASPSLTARYRDAFNEQIESLFLLSPAPMSARNREVGTVQRGDNRSSNSLQTHEPLFEVFSSVLEPLVAYSFGRSEDPEHLKEQVPRCLSTVLSIPISNTLATH